MICQGKKKKKSENEKKKARKACVHCSPNLSTPTLHPPPSFPRLPLSLSLFFLYSIPLSLSAFLYGSDRAS